MRSLIYLLTIACGAYSSYWLTIRILVPLFAQHGKFLNKTHIVLITFTCTLIFVVSLLSWLILVVGLYAYNYFKNRQ